MATRPPLIDTGPGARWRMPGDGHRRSLPRQLKVAAGEPVPLVGAVLALLGLGLDGYAFLRVEGVHADGRTLDLIRLPPNDVPVGDEAWWRLRQEELVRA